MGHPGGLGELRECGRLLPQTISHLSDDEAVAKMGHPVLVVFPALVVPLDLVAKVNICGSAGGLARGFLTGDGGYAMLRGRAYFPVDGDAASGRGVLNGI
jgi:hypothetical protein